MSSPDTKKGVDQEKIARASWLNERFKSGASVWQKDILERTRSIDKPIIFDVDETLTDTYTHRKPNPEAPEAIDTARNIGTVLIVTSATGWERVHQDLVNLNLWRDDITLMEAGNYVPPEMKSGTGSTRYWRGRLETPEYDQAIRDFVEAANMQRIECSEADFYKSASYKRIAPVFFKPGSRIVEVPLIEDEGYAVENNPGIMGLTVDPWTSSGGGQKGRERERKLFGKEPFWLPEAVEVARQYYDGITRSRIATKLAKLTESITGVPEREITTKLSQLSVLLQNFIHTAGISPEILNMTEDIKISFNHGSLNPDEFRVKYPTTFHFKHWLTPPAYVPHNWRIIHITPFKGVGRGVFFMNIFELEDGRERYVYAPTFRSEWYGRDRINSREEIGKAKVFYNKVMAQPDEDKLALIEDLAKVFEDK